MSLKGQTLLYGRIAIFYRVVESQMSSLQLADIH